MVHPNNPPIEPQIVRQHGLSAEEYDRIVELMGRHPNINELGMFSVMWSEHCSYKNSKPVLKTLPTGGERILQGPGENAGIVDIGDGWAVTFKIESHNHPSAIEPYQGAATGVGGILRDVFTMGARPIALLDSLRFGSLENAKTRHLFDGVVAGIGGYGNCMGVPTVGGEVFFDDSYEGNPLVNAMCVGLLKHDEIYRGKATGLGNPVMLVGATTGRDGIHGATFASTDLSEESADKRPSVQVGDPFMEKLLLEACLEAFKTGYIVGIQDMGAAGLTSSSCEMASRSGTGIEFDVALIPQREEKMTPYEILLSESQERMLLVAQKGKEEDLAKIFHKWGVHAVVIGQVTDTGHVVVREKGQVVVDIPAPALTDECPVYTRESREPEYYQKLKKFDWHTLPEPEDYNETLLKMLASPNIASKEWIYRQYDHMVQLNSVVRPGSDAAVLRVKETSKGIAVTTDCNSRYIYLDPYEGGKIAVAEAARNITCSGGEPLAISDGCNFGNPTKPEIFWQFKESLRGIGDACKALNTPVTGGNVSLYNENKESGTAVFPTPIVGMVGLLEHVDHHCTQAFKQEGDLIVLLGETRDELGGSEYLAHIHRMTAGAVPQMDLDLEKRVQKTCREAILKGLIRSAHDCAEGGLAIAVAESALGGNMGAAVEMDSVLSDTALLFSETQSRIVASLEEKNLPALQALAASHKISLQVIGKVGGDRFKINFIVDLPLARLRETWGGTLDEIMA